MHCKFKCLTVSIVQFHMDLGKNNLKMITYSLLEMVHYVPNVQLLYVSKFLLTLFLFQSIY